MGVQPWVSRKRNKPFAEGGLVGTGFDKLACMTCPGAGKVTQDEKENFHLRCGNAHCQVTCAQAKKCKNGKLLN